MIVQVHLTERQAERVRAAADAARLSETETIPVMLDALLLGMDWDPDELRLHLIDIAQATEPTAGRFTDSFGRN